MIGYCTNVHAGPDLLQTRRNLETHALAVKREYSPHAPMGVGLWLASPAARQLHADQQALGEFRERLDDAGLQPFTFNGFPYGDFHQAVVKHAVYEPTWADPRRLAYTKDLIAVQHALLAPGEEGTISTLPVVWRAAANSQLLQTAGRNLAEAAEHLRRLQEEQGRSICLCLEPEPGCWLDRAEHVAQFLQEHVLPNGSEESIRQHLGVCHDVCHSAVMFEEQAAALDVYRRAGIRVGNVQVSAAVAVPFDAADSAARRRAVEQLAAFDEPRYLHQSSWRRPAGVDFFEDLPEALKCLADDADRAGEVRVHFHVPIFLAQFGDLLTTQPEIKACLNGLAADVSHFEVETYAWNVLPESLRQPTLAAGIAEELKWFREVLRAFEDESAGR